MKQHDDDLATTAAEAAARRVWHGMRMLFVDNHDGRRKVAEALGMSFSRSKALRRLAAGPMTMRSLAAGLGTDAPYTTLIVDDLERLGMARRTVNPDDRRSKLVTITDAGRAAAEQAEQILDVPPAELLQVAPEDLAVLDRVISTLLTRGRKPVDDPSS